MSSNKCVWHSDLLTIALEVMHTSNGLWCRSSMRVCWVPCVAASWRLFCIGDTLLPVFAFDFAVAMHIFLFDCFFFFICFVADFVFPVPPHMHICDCLSLYAPYIQVCVCVCDDWSVMPTIRFDLLIFSRPILKLKLVVGSGFSLFPLQSFHILKKRNIYDLMHFSFLLSMQSDVTAFLLD